VHYIASQAIDIVVKNFTYSLAEASVISEQRISCAAYNSL